MEDDSLTTIEGGITPPVAETGSDELSAFFEVDGSEATRPEQILADVQEAKKDGFARRAEVNKAVADPENPTTKQGRKLGGMLVEGLAGEIELTRVSQVFGEKTVARLQEAEATDVDAVIKILKTELQELDTGGRGDIFRILQDDEATAAMGVQRRADQQQIMGLKSTLLGISEKAFETGDLGRGLAALQAARVDMISAEPTWIVGTMAEAVGKADLEKPDVRETLVRILDSYVLGTTTDMETKVATKPVEELSGIEIVLKKGLEARGINQRVEAEQRETKLKNEYNERMKAAWDKKMSQAISDGRDSFKEHFEHGDSYQARFKDYGEGSAHLAGLMKDWQLSTEVTGNHRLGGISGYLQVLENITETPGYMDKFVAKSAEQFYSDLGGKSKSEYEREEKMTEWNDHIRRQILTEIHGNALGILQGAIEYEGRGVNDQVRAQILRRSLEVLGHGHALEGLIVGRGNLTPEQVLVRKALLEYIKNPIAGQEKWAEQDQGLANRRLARLKGLKDIASQADIAVVQRQETTRELVRLKRKEEDKRQGELKGQIVKSQEHLLVIDEAKEKMLDTLARGTRIQQLSDTPNLEESLTINRKDKDSPPTVDISLNGGKERQVAQHVRELKEALEKDPHNRKLRDELAAGMVDARLLVEMKDWVSRINSPANKRTFTQTGLFKRPQGSILVTGFDAIPDPGPDVVWSGYRSDVEKTIRQLEEVNPQYKEPKKKSITELRQEVASQTQAENVLDNAAQIAQTEKALFDLENDAKKAETILALRAERTLVDLARDFVKNRLQMLLMSEHRLSYS